jgi:hypothetical protein
VGSQLHSSSALPREGLPVLWVAPGRFVKEKNFLPMSGIEPRLLDCTAHTAVTLLTISRCLITIKYADTSNLNVTWMRYDTARKKRCLWNRSVILKGMTFHWLNPSGRTVALGSTTHPLTEVRSSRCVRLTTLPPQCANCLEILEASNSWSPKSMSRPING